MKRFIIIGLLVSALLFTLGVVYLNNVFLPKTIHALIVKGIEENTGSKVQLGSLKVNIFKGLVLTDLDISKQEAPVIKVKEASCIVIPFAFLRKQIIIPNINIKSAQIFLERRKDNTFNLEDLIPPKAVSDTPKGSESTKNVVSSSPKGFAVAVYRVNISNARINFKDSTFSQPFIKTIENFNLVASLSLPASVKFRLSGVIAAPQPVKLSASGEFKIPEQELNAKLSIADFSPNEFSVYYQDSGLKITQGLISASSDFKIKNNVLYADVFAQTNNLKIQQNKVDVKTSLDLRAVLEYSLSDKILKYSGSGRVSNTEISGVEFVDKINAINTGLIFNNAGLNAPNLTADVLGLSVKAKASLNDLSDPRINISATSSLELSTLQGIMKDKFKFDFPGTISGRGNLDLAVEGKFSGTDNLAVSGEVEVINAALNLKNLDSPIQEINGKIKFYQDRLHWEDANLKYQGNRYKISGSLINFKSPLLDISIETSGISLDSVLSFNGKLIKVSKFSGSYYLSEFSATGDIDISEASSPKVDLKGELLIELKDLKRPLNKFKEQLERINPVGKVKAQFNLSGNINDLRNCNAEIKLSSDSIFLYGLRGKDLILNYAQADGIANVKSMRLSLYGGSVDAFFRANLRSKEYPYLFQANIQDVKIEEIKLDTKARTKDIAGIIQGDVKINGFFGDIPASGGAGRLTITKGKLWELDLFKGLGKLLFSQDLASITFYEGACDFIIQDKAIFTDNLTLKSNMVNLSGPVKIGFDSSINAKLNVNIMDEFIPLTGTFKDVTTAIIGESGKFAVIKISGTLQEPKYSFQTAVANILKSLADTFLKKI